MQKRIKEIVTKNYDLGVLSRVAERDSGYINQSFTLWLEKDRVKRKYLLRKYHSSTAEKEIRFEHALIDHLRKNRFELAAGVIPKMDGGTCVKQREEEDGKDRVRFWALFEFLEGEDRYTWMQTDISDAEIISAAQVLARLHHAGQNFFKPPGCDRLQPKIIDFLPTFQSVYEGYGRIKSGATGAQHFFQNLQNILGLIQKITIHKSDLKKMPHLPIHGDYHQGNLKFKRSQVVGVFDFDWSKIDIRLFDLALALVYFFACWEGKAAGSLRLDKCDLFLSGYHAMCCSTAPPGPLTRMEKKYLPLLLAAANLFLLHWAIVDFFSAAGPKDKDEESVIYIDHHLKLMYWIEKHRRWIADLTRA